MSNESYQGLKVTYYLGRDIHKKIRPAFESLGELRDIGEQMDAKVLASSRLSSVLLFGVKEALELQTNHRVYQDQAQQKLTELHASEPPHSVFARSTNIEIANEVNVYESGWDLHLGVPILGTSADRMTQERAKILTGFSEMIGEEIEDPYADQTPYLTVGIVKESNEKVAEVLSVVAADMLWSQDSPQQLGKSIPLYAPHTERVKTAVFA